MGQTWSTDQTAERPKEEEPLTLRQKIFAIQKEGSLSQEEKAKKIQRLVSGVKEEEDSTSPDPSCPANIAFKPCYNSSNEFGCCHYPRDCQFVSPCCGKLVPCRLCHHEGVCNQEFDRFAVKEMVCQSCATVQPVAAWCSNLKCSQVSQRISRHMLLALELMNYPFQSCVKDDVIEVTAATPASPSEIQEDDDDNWEDVEDDDDQQIEGDAGVAVAVQQNMPQEEDDLSSLQHDLARLKKEQGGSSNVNYVPSITVEGPRLMGRAHSCLKCNLFTNDYEFLAFHCDSCGLCRRGKAEDFNHCENCNACINKAAVDHECSPNKLSSNCPVCQEFLFNSVRPVVFMPCQHPIHRSCLETLLKQGPFCPLCRKEVADLTGYYEALDREIEQQPMPEVFQGSEVKVLCSKCLRQSWTAFHFVGLKCQECGSYNTQECERRGFPTADEINSSQAPPSQTPPSE